MIKALRSLSLECLRSACKRLSLNVDADFRDQQLVLSGRIASLEVAGLPANAPVEQSEFRVFSQFGEDGIIQFLIGHISVSSRSFIEFGVDDYIESNTRFLLNNNHWSGFIFDRNEKRIRKVQEGNFLWRHDLTVASAVIDAGNINKVFASHGVPNSVGLLSIDIDGNDYWVWKALTHCSPDIVVVEYNALLGPDRELVIPYDPDFDLMKAHYSGLYFGASLRSLVALGEAKGYRLVGCNSAGCNAFFVKEELGRHLCRPTIEEAFRPCLIRRARSRTGALTNASPREMVSLLRGLEFVNPRTGQREQF